MDPNQTGLGPHCLSLKFKIFLDDKNMHFVIKRFKG